VTDQERQIIRIGTRDSKLARLQTDRTIASLIKCYPNLQCEIATVTTSGDRVLNRPIAEVGTSGVFVKELEEALLREEVDLVVHSLKDLPTDLAPALALAAVLDREDPRDVLVSHNHVAFADLPPGARVATSSRRRTAQLRFVRQDLTFVDIRGNIPTRLQKQDQGHCDAMVLAAAGLIRLGATDRVTEYLDTAVITPAVGQGALAVECRSDDRLIRRLLEQIDDHLVRAQVTAERSFLGELGGGCSVPVGALATITAQGTLSLTGCVCAVDGSKAFRASMEAPLGEAVRLGINLAGQLMDMGAGEVLQQLKVLASHMVSPP